MLTSERITDPPSQTGILAVGRISERVVAVDRKPAVRPILMTVTHRVMDGAGAAEFLRDLADAIQEPTKWLV